MFAALDERQLPKRGDGPAIFASKPEHNETSVNVIKLEDVEQIEALE